LADGRRSPDVTFRVVDLMAGDGSVEDNLRPFLASHHRNKFNIAFVFR
jgi:hypothetical protein